MTTTVAEEIDSILKNPVSETTSSPDMIFDTTFVAEELTTNSKIESEDDLLPAFLQPSTTYCRSNEGREQIRSFKNNFFNFMLYHFALFVKKNNFCK